VTPSTSDPIEGNETVTEWRVTGDPSTTVRGHWMEFPPYRFVWTDDRMYDDRSRSEGPEALTAEAAARRFAERATDWKDGPHLHSRRVTRTPWQEARRGEEQG
jgi:hypothetical protein